MPTVEELNKAVVLRMVDIVNAQELDKLDELFDPSFVEHNALGTDAAWCRRGQIRPRARYHEAMPDIHFDITDVVAEGDKVMARGVITGTHMGDLFGVKALGKKITWTGIEICTLKNGKITERWLNADTLSMLQQMQGTAAPTQAEPQKEKPMTTTEEKNKDLYRYFIEEFWNKKRLEVADELFAPDATCPSAPALPPGPMGLNIVGQMIFNAFPDFHMTIEDLIAEGDRISARFNEEGTHRGAIFAFRPATSTPSGLRLASWRSRTAKCKRVGSATTCSQPDAANRWRPRTGIGLRGNFSLYYEPLLYQVPIIGPMPLTRASAPPLRMERGQGVRRSNATRGPPDYIV